MNVELKHCDKCEYKTNSCDNGVIKETDKDDLRQCCRCVNFTPEKMSYKCKVKGLVISCFENQEIFIRNCRNYEAK